MSLYLGVAAAALIMPGAALAQSTGSQEVEDEIVVTGNRAQEDGVDGFVVPDATKAKVVITQELISRGSAGNTILNTINLVPGVNFTQSDAYGSAGGNIRIRGFDGNRISLTFDGVPLNDSGNYAIFSNQQLDPEIIEQVNVNLGTTDVDSPTASAAGGTVNYRTVIPSDKMGALISASAGENDYTRIFGIIQTGVFTSFGTKMFVSASTTRNDKFKGPGRIDKQQYNARLYQPIGSNGDFISIAGHYNQNRNNFYRNPSVTDLRTLLGTPAVPPATTNPLFPTPANPIVIGGYTGAQEDLIMGFDNLGLCTKTSGGPGAQNDNGGALPNGSGAQLPGGANNIANTASCSNFAGVRINPSDTGNVRIQSRFSLSDNLILTVDPSFQYVRANGGGSSTIAENSAIARGSAGATSPGVDFNGDGDFLDTLRFYTPNNTNTRRWGVTASLIWDVAPEHRFRIAYTYDRARHRQTGEWGHLDASGNPESPFGGLLARPVLAADGFQLQQRDRVSIALLNQIAGQYIGKFLDEKLRVELGLRAPFFKRNLDTRCFIQTGGSGFATCTSQPINTLVIVPPSQTGNFPAGSLFAPFKAEYKYDKLLPNAGVTYKLSDEASLFASYAKGFSAPRTDNLYRAPRVDVKPETTDAFDLGLRYTTGRIQAQATGWYIGYKNRIVSSFNQDLGISLDRNVGKVTSYGFDGSIAYQPIDALSLIGLVSYIDTEIKSNVQTGSATVDCGNSATNVPAGCAPTAGKFVTETPKWQVGGRAQLVLGPVELGVQGKWVDDRFATDTNDVKVKGYTLVDLDARLSLAQWGLEKTYFQVNVSNLFDEFYFGNISTQINNAGNPNFTVGAPRTFMGSFVVGF